MDVQDLEHVLGVILDHNGDAAVGLPEGRADDGARCPSCPTSWVAITLLPVPGPPLTIGEGAALDWQPLR
jgi:hypothetical protein